MMKQKVLLVGDSRLCPQVAYVMDWQDYATVECLTDATQYRDHRIVVCALRNKSKSLIKVKDKDLKITYLDDICRELDQQYAACNYATETATSLLKRLLLKILRLWGRQGIICGQYWLRKIPARYLRPSELLLRVLYSPATDIVCDRPGRVCRVNPDGSMTGCITGVLLPFGNIKTQNPAVIYNDARARIIKLSSINRSYCLCNVRKCEFANRNIAPHFKDLPPQDHPVVIELALDEACNLNCPSCRRELNTGNAAAQEGIERMVTQLLDAGWLDKAGSITLASMGEVFYSPNYRRLITTDFKRKQIFILSNGTLFNQANWDLLKDKYEQIDVSISVDAATPTTYQKVRGGDFKQLQQNLAMLSELRQAGKINFLEINFVVQQDNYRDMPAFVKWGKELRVDHIWFKQLEDWGTFDGKDYAERRMVIKNRYLAPELYAVLQDPIFKDPIVDITSFQPYLASSAKRYGEWNETSGREQQMTKSGSKVIL